MGDMIETETNDETTEDVDTSSSGDDTATMVDETAPDSEDTTNFVPVSTSDGDASDAAKPSPEYVDGVLTGVEALTKVSEAAAILADAEAALAVLEPLGGILTVISMALNL